MFGGRHTATGDSHYPGEDRHITSYSCTRVTNVRTEVSPECVGSTDGGH